MNTHSDKTQDKNQSVAKRSSLKSNNNKPAFHLDDHRPESVQLRNLKEMVVNSNDHAQPIQKKGNKTGLPDYLKSGIENLSGYSMDDVKVHYNSSKPAKLSAHAYAQGTDIHVAPGQEKHLPHEAWHIVQQKQGRVKPTMQMKGKVNINDDPGLEKEADIMGGKTVQLELDRENWKEDEWGTSPKEEKDYPNIAESEERLTAPKARGSALDKEVKKIMKVSRKSKKSRTLIRSDGKKVQSGNYRYVVSAKGALYIELDNESQQEIGQPAVVSSHPDILGNKHVQTAGWLTVKKGKVKIISNHSGHYKPDAENHAAAVEGLKKARLVPKKVKVEYRTEKNTQY